MDFSPDGTWFDPYASTTEEEAISTWTMCAFPGNVARRVGLVTSALHMTRSVKVFRKNFPNDTIVPVPVNHIYSPNWNNLRGYIPSSANLWESNNALHEWIGMVRYVIRY